MGGPAFVSGCGPPLVAPLLIEMSLADFFLKDPLYT